MAGRSWELRPDDYEELEHRVAEDVDAWERGCIARGLGALTPAERESCAEHFRPAILRALKHELRD